MTNNRQQTRPALAPQAIESLRSILRGSVFAPGDDGYDAGRATWELSTEHRPAIVVEPEGAADVMAAVRFARAHGLPVAAQATGHGPIVGCDGVLVNMRSMKNVSIDPGRRIARVEGGVVWREVLAAAAPYGLAGLCGSSPGVGVVGYTLGGGTGWLARKYGYACDSVVAAEVVTGDGRLLRANEHEHTDLFWALRGGGGAFAIVTALEFRLYPVERVYGGSMFFPIERAREVLNVYSNWTRHVPDTMTSSVCLQHLPDLPFVPASVRGKSFVVIQGCFIGSEEQGMECVSPLRNLAPVMNDFAMMPYCEVGRIAREPEDPMPSHIGTETLRELSPRLIDAIVEAAGARDRTTLGMVAIRHVGGAYAQLTEDASAAPRLNAPFVLLSLGLALPQIRDRVIHDTNMLLAACRPYCGGAPLFNFLGAAGLERGQHVDLFGAAKTELLKKVKERYDPYNLFQFGMPVNARQAAAA
jgi:hypothetical protein